MKFHKTLQETHSTAFIKQVVKVITHKAALPQIQLHSPGVASHGKCG